MDRWQSIRPQLQQRGEIDHRQTRLTEDRPQSSLGTFTMVGNRDAAMRRLSISQCNMAASLMVDSEPDFRQHLHDLLAGYNQTLAQTSTSSESGGGTGSPRFSRLSRLPAIASLMLANASMRLAPCEMQPGRAGTSATNTPASSASIKTRYHIVGSFIQSIVRMLCYSATSARSQLEVRVGED